MATPGGQSITRPGCHCNNGHMTGSEHFPASLRLRLKNATYLHDGQLFFKSRRAFRILAPVFGIASPDNIHPGEHVFFYVTPGWWVGSLLRPNKNLSAVVTRKPFGRFGNQTLQLANALTIARAFHAPAVVCPGNEVLNDFDRQLPDGTHLTTTPQALGRTGLGSLIRGLFVSWSANVHLVGNFFYLTALSPHTVTPDERSTSYALIKQARDNHETVPALPADHLVVHLRGGDAFGPTAHNEYGQPPLAFYELILSRGPWSHLTIVSADDSNPVLPHLIEKAQQANIPYSLQSGSVEEDMRVLLSAITLVASRTTFIPAIAALSDNAREVFVFGDDDRFPTHLTISRVIDTVGNYWNQTCVYNWMDEPWQRELMVSYPASNLSWASRAPETTSDGEGGVSDVSQ